MGPATRSKLTVLAVLFGEHGLGGKERRPDRLRLCSDHAGRYLTTSAQLTDVEASTLIERLDKLPRDGCLAKAAARLVVEEERAAAMHAGKVEPGRVELAVDVARAGDTSVVTAVRHGDQLTLLPQEDLER